VGCEALAYKARCGEPVSLQSELLALRVLAGACHQQLLALPTSYEEDLLLLEHQHQQQQQGDQQQDQQTTCLQLALQWRCAYKSTLQACISSCEAVLLHASARA
jgi:hypothetical protein